MGTTTEPASTGAALREEAAAPAGPGEGGDGRRDRLLVGVAVLPLVVAAVALIVDVGGSFHPTGDLAASELAVRDIGQHPVLHGLYSRADWSHPGPMLFYLLWPVYRLSGGSGIALAVGALVINGACVVGVAHLARRRGGTPLLVCSLLGCALLVRSLGAGFTASYWNLHITTLPLVLLVFLVWSLACGDRWALPATAVVATFLAQTHVGFLPVGLGLAAWGAGCLVVAALRASPPFRVVEARQAAAPVALTAGLMAVLWLPPAIDVAANAPSNARLIARWFNAAEEGTHTLAEGWRVVSAQFGVAPEWLIGRRPPGPGFAESAYLHSAPMPVLLAAVAVAAWALWRWNPRSGRALVTTLAATLVISVAAVARTVGPVFDYRLRWTWVPATVAFVAVAWAGWLAVERRRARVAHRWALPVLVAALVAVCGVDAVAAAGAGTPEPEDSDIMAALTPPVLDELDRLGIDPEDEVVVSDPYASGMWFANGLIVQLDRRGYDVTVPASRRWQLGDHRVTDGGAAVNLVVASDRMALDMLDAVGSRTVATWSVVRLDDAGLATLEATYDAIDETGEAWASGEIDVTEFDARGAEIDRALPPRGDLKSRLVAVFLVESPVRGA